MLINSQHNSFTDPNLPTKSMIDASMIPLTTSEVKDIVIIEDGDEILIDAENNRLELLVDKSLIEERLSNWVKPSPKYTKGVLAKYAKLAQSASRGAITE